MKLIIDIGNTITKAAVFSGNEMKAHFEYESVNEFNGQKLVKQFKIKNCFVSCVADHLMQGLVVEQLLELVPVQVFSSNHILPFKNKYKTPKTIGTDRLAAVAGGNFLYPNKDVLVIDAGTCIKYNFINKKNEFLGGGISPGLRMRFTALSEGTALLPEVSINPKFDSLIGTNTTDSILSGVLMGAITEVDGIIDQYKKLYNNLTVVITGGDGNFFAERLKNSIFADQFLILKGLNVILDTVINE